MLNASLNTCSFLISGLETVIWNVSTLKGGVLRRMSKNGSSQVLYFLTSEDVFNEDFFSSESLTVGLNPNSIVINFA